MIHNKNIIENRGNVLNMLALTEEVIRTTQGLHSLISNLMNDQDEGSNIKSSVEDLYKKVTNLKKFNIKLPLIEEEKVLVLGPDDASLPEDPDYVEPKIEKTPKPQKTKETLEDRKLRVPKKTRKPRKNLRKKLPSPDINSI